MYLSRYGQQQQYGQQQYGQQHQQRAPPRPSNIAMVVLWAGGEMPDYAALSCRSLEATTGVTMWLVVAAPARAPGPASGFPSPA